MEEKIYLISKAFYEKRISIHNARNKLSEIGIKNNKENDLILLYQKLINGQLIKNNEKYFEYFIGKIFEEKGTKGLEKALLSIAQYTEYKKYQYENSKSISKKIYNKYWNLSTDASLHPNMENVSIKVHNNNPKIILKRKGLRELHKDYQKARHSLMNSLKTSNLNLNNIEESISIELTEKNYGKLTKISKIENIYKTQGKTKILIKTIIENQKIEIKDYNFDKLLVFRFSNRFNLKNVIEIPKSQIKKISQEKLKNIEQYGVDNTLKVLMPYFL